MAYDAPLGGSSSSYPYYGTTGQQPGYANNSMDVPLYSQYADPTYYGMEEYQPPSGGFWGWLTGIVNKVISFFIPGWQGGSSSPYGADPYYGADYSSSGNADFMAWLNGVTAKAAEAAHWEPPPTAEVTEAPPAEPEVCPEPTETEPEAACPETPPEEPREPNNHNAQYMIEQLNAVDNGDGVYTPAELRAAAERECRESERNMYLFLADMSEAYGIPITAEKLLEMAQRSGNPETISYNEIANLPWTECAMMLPDQHSDKYADITVLMGLLAQGDTDGNGVYRVDEMQALLQGLEDGSIPCQDKERYIDVLRKLIEMAEKRGGFLMDWQVAKAGRAIGDDRWITADDINDETFPQAQG